MKGLFVILVSVSLFGQTAAQAVPGLSLEALCEKHPERVQGLFEALDLERPGLEAAAGAAAKADWVGACEALLAYYAQRMPAVPASVREAKASEAAEAMLERRFTFYRETGTVPLTAAGGMDWDHRGPSNDREWAWGLNRHSHLHTLLGAYRDTGDPRFVSAINAHLEDWVLSNPYPGQKSATGPWRGLEAALRTGAWTEVFGSLQFEGGLSPAVRILMLSSLLDHAHYLRHFHANTSNWITMEMNGLTRIALRWPEFKKAGAWVDYAIGQITPELERQVYPDGAQMELTSHYHYVTARNFKDFAAKVRKSGRDLPETYATVLERMWGYLAYTMRPNGYGLLNNDSDYDHTRPTIRAYARTYSRPDWTYVATNGEEGQAPEWGPSVFLPWAGQAVLRSGWDKDARWAFFDVGPLGTAHRHHDKLHLSVSAYGRDLLVDSGRWSYVPDLWRRHFTGPAAHNVLLLDGKGPMNFPARAEAPLEAAHHFGEVFDYVRGTFDSGYHGIEGEASHTRAVVHVKEGFWIVADRIATDRPRAITALWHFHPDCHVLLDGNAAITDDPGQGNLRLVPGTPLAWDTELVAGRETPEIQGWYSPRYGEKVPASTAVYRCRIEGSTAFAWLLVPAKGTVPPARLRVEAREAEGLVLTVKIGDGAEASYALSWTADPEFAFGPLSPAAGLK